MNDESFDIGGTTEPFEDRGTSAQQGTSTASSSSKVPPNSFINELNFAGPSASSSNSPGCSSNRHFDLNLAPLETKTGRYIPPYSIYIGNGIVLQISKFKNDYYLAFGKEEDDGLVKPRINIPIRYVESLRRDIVIIEKHINNNNN